MVQRQVLLYVNKDQSNTGNYGRSISNFGQKPFKYTPPDGFQPLTSSTARPDTVVANSEQYFEAVTYTGNGSTQSISGLKNLVQNQILSGSNKDLPLIKIMHSLTLYVDLDITYPHQLIMQRDRIRKWSNW